MVQDGEDQDELLKQMQADEAKNPAKPTVQGPVQGVRLPLYKPVVTASFAARNLSGNPRENITEGDELAGRDPWAICDYLRDSLSWPACLIFIDAEQNGMYDLDHYHLDQKCIDGDPKQPCPFWKALEEGGHKGIDCGCVANPKFGKHDGSRNWKAAFQWAQRNSHCMLYFMSDFFFESDNCMNEFRDYCKLLRDGTVTAVPVIALLDEKLKVKAEDMMTEMGNKAEEQGMGHIERRQKFNTANIFDLSQFMQWKIAQEPGGDGGHKMELREASREMQKLRDKVEDIAGGKGNPEVYYQDVLHGWACKDILDDKGHPVRNRYKKDVRRVNINTADENELTKRLPSVGPVKAANIVAHRKRIGGLKHAGHLFDIESIGETTLEDLFPFVTFGLSGEDGEAQLQAREWESDEYGSDSD